MTDPKKYDIEVSARKEKYSTRKILISSFAAGGGEKLFFIAGPCVIEDPESVLTEARALKEKAEIKK